MNISIRLGDQKATELAILRGIRDKMDLVFRQAAPAVKGRIAEYASRLVEATPEFDSLMSGYLLGELGVPDVERRMQEVLAAIAQNAEVRAVPVRILGSQLSGGMFVGILRSNFEDLLSLAAASYVSQPSGSEIKWLDWLLTQGDMILVYGYDVVFDLSASQKAKSRTGMALMEKGQGWRVPPEFSGTPEDNFLTRAFDVFAAEAGIARVFQQEIYKRL